MHLCLYMYLVDTHTSFPMIRYIRVSHVKFHYLVNFRFHHPLNFPKLPVSVFCLIPNAGYLQSLNKSYVGLFAANTLSEQKANNLPCYQDCRKYAFYVHFSQVRNVLCYCYTALPSRKYVFCVKVNLIFHVVFCLYKL